MYTLMLICKLTLPQFPKPPALTYLKNQQQKKKKSIN